MHDVVTLGEVLLRLAVPSPARFETARALDVQIGGAEANVAAACARLGLRTAWISALPDNPWGERVRRELVGHGIDCAYVRMLPGTRLGLYFLEYGVAPRPVHVLYDRRDCAFSRLTPDAVDWAPIQRARAEGDYRPTARRGRLYGARWRPGVASNRPSPRAGGGSDRGRRRLCRRLPLGNAWWADAAGSRERRRDGCCAEVLDLGRCRLDQPTRCRGRPRRRTGRPPLML